MSKKTFGGNELSKNLAGAIQKILDEEKKKHSNELNDLKTKIIELKNMFNSFQTEFNKINNKIGNAKTRLNIVEEIDNIAELLETETTFNNLYNDIVSNRFLNNKMDNNQTYKEFLIKIEQSYDTLCNTLKIYIKQNTDRLTKGSYNR